MGIALAGSAAARTRDIVKLIFGCIAVFAILGISIAVLAAPVYVMAILIAEAGAPTWLVIVVGSAACIAEIYGLSLVFDGIED